MILRRKIDAWKTKTIILISVRAEYEDTDFENSQGDGRVVEGESDLMRTENQRSCLCFLTKFIKEQNRQLLRGKKNWDTENGIPQNESRQMKL